MPDLSFRQGHRRITASSNSPRLASPLRENATASALAWFAAMSLGAADRGAAHALDGLAGREPAVDLGEAQREVIDHGATTLLVLHVRISDISQTDLSRYKNTDSGDGDSGQFPSICKLLVAFVLLLFHISAPSRGQAQQPGLNAGTRRLNPGLR